MCARLRITVRFLDGNFHGRGDGDEPEWPPSPLRLYQAIVAAAATRWVDDSQKAKDTLALRWLEQLPPPSIVAARRAAVQPHGYLLYVPNNEGDIVAKTWAAGGDDNIANYRTDKFVRPTRLTADGPDGSAPTVHYLWPVAEDLGEAIQSLITAARSISRLGWGIDFVVADASVDASNETNIQWSGERWLPVNTTPGGTSLRVPVAGTFEALEQRHAAFIGRLQTAADGSQFFRPVPPLAAFRVVTYRRDTDPPQLPCAVFALRRPDDSGFAVFDPQRRRLHLTGMLRHAASRPDFVAALGWNAERASSFILGHDKSGQGSTKPTSNTARIAFVPLPSIEWRGDDDEPVVGAIRRVLVAIVGNAGPSEIAEFHKIVRALEGRELIDERSQRPVAFLCRQSARERAIAPYFEVSSTWTTVIPLVLPGHDDPRKLRRRLGPAAMPLAVAEKEQIIRKLDVRTGHLLRKALLDSGMPSALVADADLQWRSTGFIRGVGPAADYSVPDQCRRYRRLHVRIVWRSRSADGQFHPMEVCGPLCFGGGRFSGAGLFVPVS